MVSAADDACAVAVVASVVAGVAACGLSAALAVKYVRFRTCAAHDAAHVFQLLMFVLLFMLLLLLL